MRAGSVISIAIYALIAVIALDRAGVIEFVPDIVSTVGMWVIFAYFALGIVLNAISKSKPERAVMVPLTIELIPLATQTLVLAAAGGLAGGQDERAIVGDRDRVLSVRAA